MSKTKKKIKNKTVNKETKPCKKKYCKTKNLTLKPDLSIAIATA